MPANHPSDNHASPGAKVLNTLASVKFAVTVVVLIALACVAGTLIPQGTDVAKYVRLHPEAATRMEWFGKLGLTHVFYCGWFLVLLCVLAASIMTCSIRRFATVRRTTGFARRRAFGSMVTHISMLLIITGGVIRGGWGEKGYVELVEGQTVASFQVEQGEQPLPFALHLADFEIETYTETKKPESDDCNHLLVEWPEKNLKASLPVQLDAEQVVAPKGEKPTAENSFRIKVLKYVADFVVDTKTREVTSRSNTPNNPALLLAITGPNYQNHRWVFAKFPDFGMQVGGSHTGGELPLKLVYQNHGAAQPQFIDGPIKSFKSTLQVFDDDNVGKTTTVEVNRPFKHKGYTFYQSGYNPRDLRYTSLQVVKDPGVPIVYTGFILMIVGLFIVFYLNPWIESRKATA